MRVNTLYLRNGAS